MTPAAMLARADAVLVDLDGTLVDSSALGPVNLAVTVRQPGRVTSCVRSPRS